MPISSPGRTGAGQRTSWSAPPIETCATQPLRMMWPKQAAWVCSPLAMMPRNGPAAAASASMWKGCGSQRRAKSRISSSSIRMLPKSNSWPSEQFVEGGEGGDHARSPHISDCMSPSTASDWPLMVAPNGLQQVQRHVGDILRRHVAAQRHGLQRLRLLLGEGAAVRLRLGFQHPADAVAGDQAGQDGVDPYALRPQLDRQRLGEADDAPFRRGIGAAQREAEAAGRGGQVDDDPPPAARSAGTARRAQWNMASRSIFSVRVSASGVTSSTRAVGPAMPALFTSTSRPPRCAMAEIDEALAALDRLHVGQHARGAGRRPAPRRRHRRGRHGRRSWRSRPPKRGRCRRRPR